MDSVIGKPKSCSSILAITRRARHCVAPAGGAGVGPTDAYIQSWLDQAAHKETATATLSQTTPLKTGHDSQTNKGRKGLLLAAFCSHLIFRNPFKIPAYSPMFCSFFGVNQ